MNWGDVVMLLVAAADLHVMDVVAAADVDLVLDAGGWYAELGE